MLAFGDRGIGREGSLSVAVAALSTWEGTLLRGDASVVGGSRLEVDDGRTLAVNYDCHGERNRKFEGAMLKTSEPTFADWLPTQPRTCLMLLQISLEAGIMLDSANSEVVATWIRARRYLTREGFFKDAMRTAETRADRLMSLPAEEHTFSWRKGTQQEQHFCASEAFNAGQLKDPDAVGKERRKSRQIGPRASEPSSNMGAKWGRNGGGA